MKLKIFFTAIILLIAAQVEAAEIFGVTDIISRVAVTNLKGEVVQTFPNARDEMLAELKYCTKLKYVDIGHNGFKDLSFVEYLPDLEVLILENDDVSDLSPLVHCQKLEYLDPFTNERYIPYIVESTYGLDRTGVVCFLAEAAIPGSGASVAAAAPRAE